VAIPARRAGVLPALLLSFVTGVNIEGTVFAAARQRGLRIVAMKVLGGAEGDGARLSAPDHYGSAIRYALGIPGLSVAILGMKSPAEVALAVRSVKEYQPLAPAEVSGLSEKGKQMAKAWGPLRGPVA
jgi:hypothetical protein